MEGWTIAAISAGSALFGAFLAFIGQVRARAIRDTEFSLGLQAVRAEIASGIRILELGIKAQISEAIEEHRRRSHGESDKH